MQLLGTSPLLTNLDPNDLETRIHTNNSNTPLNQLASDLPARGSHVKAGTPQFFVAKPAQSDPELLRNVCGELMNQR